MEKCKQVLDNKEVLSRVSDFLGVSEWIKMSQLSQRYQQLMNEYIGVQLEELKIVKKNKVENKEERQKELMDESVVTLSKVMDENEEDECTDYVRMLRQHYRRRVVIGGQQKNEEGQQGLRVVECLSMLAGKGIQQVQTGPVFTTVTLYDARWLIFYTEQLMLLQPITHQNYYDGVIQMSCLGNQLVWLDKKGSLFLREEDKENQQLGMNEEKHKRQIMNEKKLISIEVGYNLLVAEDDSNILWVYCLQENKVAQLEVTQQMGEKQQLMLSGNILYYLNKQGSVYQIDLVKKLQGEEEYLVIVESLKKKKIKELYGGFQSCFGLVQESRPPMAEWNNEEVIRWVDTVPELIDYAQIIKYEKITGNDLVQADQEFLTHRLGLSRRDLVTLFSTEVRKHRFTTFLSQELYAWGRNTSQQLGLKQANNLASAQKVKLPFASKIEEILVGSKASIFRIKGQGLYTTVQVGKERKEKKEKKEKIEKKEKREKKEKKEKKKEMIERDQIVETAQQLIVTLDYGSGNKVAGVHVYKETVALLLEEEEGRSTLQKMKTADQILDRLQWDSRFDQTEFTLGYEDRFLGVLEVSLQQFRMSDAKEHRIRFFKRNGHVVWDRGTKTNHIY